mmetsp:Transcript_77950/g.128975  ORF Transcript_77950/g.128975 Transcript_77950/m.128975 type:complete len:332 (-) Transcript_77950:134-1129(-)
MELPLPLQEESKTTGNGDAGEDASLLARLQQLLCQLLWQLRRELGPDLSLRRCEVTTSPELEDLELRIFNLMLLSCRPPLWKNQLAEAQALLPSFHTCPTQSVRKGLRNTSCFFPHLLGVFVFSHLLHEFLHLQRPSGAPQGAVDGTATQRELGSVGPRSADRLADEDHVAFLLGQKVHEETAGILDSEAQALTHIRLQPFPVGPFVQGLARSIADAQRKRLRCQTCLLIQLIKLINQMLVLIQATCHLDVRDIVSVHFDFQLPRETCGYTTLMPDTHFQHRDLLPHLLKELIQFLCQFSHGMQVMFDLRIQGIRLGHGLRTGNGVPFPGE